ncbi:cytotoxic necrotizing factor Rho-activating domain-containing protein [Paraburkholderia sp. GAS348]|uniref:cytotoxic necrotizing factor Rho-activating domain-containing protein n=1 Tax=Paraburkholderia sp. GAS348 TaxID=3035132 RepID=UPI003D2235A3
MHTYAERDSATGSKRRGHNKVVKQPHVVESRWADQVERIGRDGEWNFELADSMPYLISELPCWKEGGLALHVRSGPTNVSFGELERSAGDVYIEVADDHYWTLINGERVWVRPDGNCFFNAIWKALQASENVDAVKRIFRGKVPASEREAVDYFRREIQDYALSHPELEAILLGDDGRPSALRGQPQSRCEVRKALCGPVHESLSARDAATGNGVCATPEHLRTLSGLQGDDETDADEFFDASDTADGLANPERREQPALAPQRAGSNETSRPQKRVRRLTPFANQYRGASGTDRETSESSSFRTAAHIAKRTSEQIGRPAAVMSPVYGERQEIFRALGAHDVLKALSPVLIPDGFEDAACDADWMPPTAQDAGLADSDRDEIAASFRTPTRVKWSTPLVEYRPIPLACHTESQRVLFSAGSRISEWIAHSELLTFGYWLLAKVSPTASVAAAAGAAVYNLVTALKQRDVLGGLIQALSALPYQLLSPQSLLFAVAEETKRYVDDVLDGVVPECLSGQRENIYMTVGVVSLISYYGYFVKRQTVNSRVSNVLHGPAVYPPNGFLFENDMQPPETSLGEKIAGMIGYLQRAVQSYAVLQTVVDAKPTASLATVVEPVCPVDDDPNAERMRLSHGEKATQKQERQARFIYAKSRMARLRASASARGSAAAPPGEAPGVPKAHPAASPQHSVGSSNPVITVAVGTALAARTGLSRTGTLLAAMTLASVFELTAGFPRSGIFHSRKTNNPEVDVPQTAAEPLSRKCPDVDSNMHTAHSKWIDLKGKNLECVRSFLEARFDYRFFENALDSISDIKNGDRPSGKDENIYETAVRQAFLDYSNKLYPPVYYLSSENRYGQEFYSILKEINNSDDTGCTSQKFRRLESILIKIKAYETFIIRRQQGLRPEGKEGVIAKLESVFDLPIDINQPPLAIESLDDYIVDQLGNRSRTAPPGPVAEGVSIALRLWADNASRVPIGKTGLSTEMTSAIRCTIKAKILELKEEIYNLRGPRDHIEFEIKTRTLLAHRYASRYIENRMALCRNYRNVLDKIKSKLPAAVTTPEDATVFEARALAVKATLQMLGENQSLPHSLHNLSTAGYLDNFALVTGSSPEVTTFVSFAEAIFYKSLTGSSIYDLYSYNLDPTKLLIEFNNKLSDLPFTKRRSGIVDEAEQFIKNIKPNAETGSDSEYYGQFVTFRSKYLSPLAEALSLFALFDYGLHPYRMLIEKPIKVIKTIVFTKPATESPPLPSKESAQRRFFMDMISMPIKFREIVLNIFDAGYSTAGELIFCEMASGSWTVISTLNGRFIIKSVTAAEMTSNKILSAISSEKDYLRPLPAISPKKNLLWKKNQLFTKVIHPVLRNTTSLDATMFSEAYLVLDRPDRNDFSGNRLIEITDAAAKAMLKIIIDQKEDLEFHMHWWQYITLFIPGFDMAYHAVNDPDYHPSNQEIAEEVTLDLLTLVSIAIPGAELSLQSAKALRISVFDNLLKGHRGKALLMAILADTARDLSLFPIRLFAIASYELFAFWEPLPLRAISTSVFRRARKFKFKSGFKLISQKAVAKEKINTINPEIRGESKPGANTSNKAQGIVLARNDNDIRYYEFSYSFENEALRRAPVSGGKASHLIDLTRVQSEPIYKIVSSARKRALNSLDNALKALTDGKDAQKVDEALDIFLGRHTDVVKERLREELAKIKTFLSKLDVGGDVSYQAGYLDNQPKILMLTRAAAALGDWKNELPPITIYVDAVVDASLRKSFTQSEFKNYLATVLIHEAYHAVKRNTPDCKYAKISGNSVDIADIVALPEPQLRGENAQEIMREFGLSPSELHDLLEAANKATLKNPDNLAYLTASLDYIRTRHSDHDRFITDYRRWKIDRDSPLEWQFKDHQKKGGPIQLTHTDIGDLVQGDIKPLARNGLLYRKSSSEIRLGFDATRFDSHTIEMKKEFSLADSKFSDVLDTWKGGDTTSQGRDDVWSGTWGKDNLLNDDISIVELTSGKSGTAAIRIKLEDVKEGYPVVVSGGELSGSTIVFGVDEQYFYAFHAGQKTDDQKWRPDQEGAAGIYQAYLALNGEVIPSLGISEDMALVNEHNELAGNRGIVDILEKYESGFFAFSGKSAGSPPGEMNAEKPIEWLDYAPAATDSAVEKGRAYALLARCDGDLKITAYAEGASSMHLGRGARQKTPGKQFVLKGTTPAS